MLTRLDWTLIVVGFALISDACRATPVSVRLAAWVERWMESATPSPAQAEEGVRTRRSPRGSVPPTPTTEE